MTLHSCKSETVSSKETFQAAGMLCGEMGQIKAISQHPPSGSSAGLGKQEASELQPGGPFPPVALIAGVLE